MKPMAKGLACRTEFQKASTVWPDSVRPDLSVIVPEIQIGSFSIPSFSRSMMALIQALQFSVSVIVSIR